MVQEKAKRIEQCEESSQDKIKGGEGEQAGVSRDQQGRGGGKERNEQGYSQVDIHRSRTWPPAPVMCHNMTGVH